MMAQSNAKRVTRQPLVDALRMGAHAWDTVVMGANSASPFMSWAWHNAWVQAAPGADVAASEVLALRWTDGSLRALMPLRLCRSRFRRIAVPVLTWAIGDAGCPDDLDVPALPGTDMAVLAAELEALPWHVLVLSNLVPGAPHAERLRAALVARRHKARKRPLWSCPQLLLPGSWDAQLASLSADRRQLLRRKERALRREHAVALTDYGEDRLDEGWAHLLSLHERRWSGRGGGAKGGGAFRDPFANRLQRHFAGEMARQHRLWLTTLDVDGRPAAAWYGFASDHTVYFYQSGRDPRWERESVGLVLMSLMVQRAIRLGYRAFNFLRGNDPYKKQWTTAPRMTEEIVVFRSGLKGLCLRVLDQVGEARRRRRLRRAG